MSIHNIGFYEDLTKIIFDLSSNFIKYAPYFFCCGKEGETNSKKHEVVLRFVNILLCSKLFYSGGRELSKP